jgi:hypothetical protein
VGILGRGWVLGGCRRWVVRGLLWVHSVVLHYLEWEGSGRVYPFCEWLQ